ncbi:hypothetical protein [Celerinatantimonas diazotrophica]|uniref:Uncharacterized protein n=1 Tax=Celerinatantimonas diazotrophica TaxID=412034 RepID=A0A4V2PRG8_9GAMM|nr:hypothetical protein [Celerinatantimonas diazotrophica]TCK58741.1 hypothetical protein EV690_0885 [Celerinatantimonas diazotrophica]CAG9297372.1 hypothetical protein CEDIAZO_02553 [Celerinatantimonas diazotrophica]
MVKKRHHATHSPRRRIQLARQHKKTLWRQRSFALTELIGESEN